jgi:hypothetical protein
MSSSSSWSPEDFEAVAEVTGLNQHRTIYPFPNRPDLGITLNLSPLEWLAVQGRLDNRLYWATMESTNKVRTDRTDDGALRDPDEFEKRLREHNDLILAAIIEEPPWAPIAEVPSDGRTPGRLNYWILPPNVRRAIIATTTEGEEALKPFFRESGESSELPRDGESVQQGAESVASTEHAAPPTDTVRPSGMVGGNGSGTGRDRVRPKREREPIVAER